MFRSLTLLSSLLAVGYCSICCVPPQWEGAQASLMGVLMDGSPDVLLVQEYVNISYDATNKMVAASHYLDVNNGQGGTVYVRYIMDYNSGVQYTFNATGCRRTTLGLFGQTCIPDDAQMAGTTYIGAGPGKLNVTNYQYMRGDIEVNTQVTTEGCIPIGEVISGKYDGGKLHQTVGYSGITPGIKDPSVFTPPAMCANSMIYQANPSADRRLGVFTL